MIRFLSHPLRAQVPVYGRTADLELRQERSIGQGDTCNEYWVGFNNHWGTHVDCPLHFFDKASQVVEYEAPSWYFSRPQIIEAALMPGQLLTPGDLQAAVKPETDLLLLKSGWGKWRGEEIYSKQNPGLDPALGNWLKKEYPSIRAVGIDWISAGSYLNREAGRQAHQAFLDPAKRPILLVEDMDLSAPLEGLKEVWIAPLRIEGIDSAPCTVFGIFE